MQKIAIPVLDHKLSPQFKNSTLFHIFLIDGQLIIKESLTHLPSRLHESLAVWLAKKGITDIITKQIDQSDVNLFNRHKINVFVGVEPETPRILIQEYIDGTLETHDILQIQ